MHLLYYIKNIPFSLQKQKMIGIFFIKRFIFDVSKTILDLWSNIYVCPDFRVGPSFFLQNYAVEQFTERITRPKHYFLWGEKWENGVKTKKITIYVAKLDDSRFGTDTVLPSKSFIRYFSNRR